MNSRSMNAALWFITDGHCFLEKKSICGLLYHEHAALFIAGYLFMGRWTLLRYRAA